MKELKQETQIEYLDLNKVKLHIFEIDNEVFTVESIIKGIEEGDDFPAVIVYKLSETEYALDPKQYLSGSRKDGGHHRAIGHYITNQLLKCEVKPYPGSWIASSLSLNPLLTKVELYEDMAEFKLRKESGPAYRDIK